MITNAILVLFRSVVEVFLNLLPPLSVLPAGVNMALESFADIYSSWASVITPLDTFITLLSFVLLFEYYNLLLHFTLWVINKIR